MRNDIRIVILSRPSNVYHRGVRELTGEAEEQECVESISNFQPSPIIAICDISLNLMTSICMLQEQSLAIMASYTHSSLSLKVWFCDAKHVAFQRQCIVVPFRNVVVYLQ